VAQPGGGGGQLGYYPSKFLKEEFRPVKSSLESFIFINHLGFKYDCPN